MSTLAMLNFSKMFDPLFVMFSVADPGGHRGHAPQTVDKSFFTHLVYQL